jgi:hypothetical protein
MPDVPKSWNFLNAGPVVLRVMILPMLAWKLYNLRSFVVLEISASKGLDTQPDPALHGLISVLGG